MKNLEDKNYTHPSFGLMEISKISCSPQNLFGSSLQSENTIRFRICRAEVNRHLNSDWFHQLHGKGNGIVEFEMSYSQFAQAITSLNHGEGTPITLLRVNGEEQERCPGINRITQLEDEFEDTIKSILKQSDEDSKKIEEILEKTSLTKADRKNIKELSNNIRRTIRGHIPFIQSQFNKQMEASVKEAKGEIQAFQDIALKSAGLKSVQEMKLLLESSRESSDGM
jgi:hypothetical protein